MSDLVKEALAAKSLEVSRNFYSCNCYLIHYYLQIMKLKQQLDKMKIEINSKDKLIERLSSVKKDKDSVNFYNMTAESLV